MSKLIPLVLLIGSLASAAACGGSSSTPEPSAEGADAGDVARDAGPFARDAAEVVDAARAVDAAPEPRDAAVDPWGLPPTCSGTMVAATVGRPTDQPGSACVACHTSGGGPRWNLGGTVYPTGHEPTLCTGVDGASKMTVELTGGNGSHQVLAVNAVGNFFGTATVTSPFTAKIVRAGSERASGATHTAAMGDCNGCHTQAGTGGAKGRLVGP
jgi:hypothetical protein